jgi:hypothetical protein
MSLKAVGLGWVRLIFFMNFMYGRHDNPYNMTVLFYCVRCLICGRYSDSLRAGRCRVRTSVKAGFSEFIQTSAEAHPASYNVGTGCL